MVALVEGAFEGGDTIGGLGRDAMKRSVCKDGPDERGMRCVDAGNRKWFCVWMNRGRFLWLDNDVLCGGGGGGGCWQNMPCRWTPLVAGGVFAIQKWQATQVIQAAQAYSRIPTLPCPLAHSLLAPTFPAFFFSSAASWRCAVSRASLSVMIDVMRAHTRREEVRVDTRRKWRTTDLKQAAQGIKSR